MAKQIIDPKLIASNQIEHLAADTEGRQHAFTERLKFLASNQEHHDFLVTLIQQYLEHNYYWYDFAASLMKLQLLFPATAEVIHQSITIAILRQVPEMNDTYAIEYIIPLWSSLTDRVFRYLLGKDL